MMKYVSRDTNITQASVQGQMGRGGRAGGGGGGRGPKAAGLGRLQHGTKPASECAGQLAMAQRAQQAHLPPPPWCHWLPGPGPSFPARQPPDKAAASLQR